MSDVLPHFLTRLSTLEEKLRESEAALDAIRRTRHPQFEFPLQLRTAITCDPAANSYPSANANVFPIKFLDADFAVPDYSGSAQQTLNKTNRQSAAACTALHLSGNWIPKDTVVSVYQCRGLGNEDAGDWLITDGPKGYFGKLAANISGSSSFSAKVYANNDASDTLLATLTVYPGKLLGSATFAANTWIYFIWDEIRDLFVMVSAACAPEA